MLVLRCPGVGGRARCRDGLRCGGGDGRAAALRSFHRCSSLLERELHVEPCPETAAVYTDLFASAPPGRGGRAASSRADRGIPLFVVEALRQETGPVPRGGAVLAERFDHLGPAALKVAGLAAAVGRDFSLDLLAAAGDLGSASLTEVVDELWRRRLLREYSATGYDFAHDLPRVAPAEAARRPGPYRQGRTAPTKLDR